MKRKSLAMLFVTMLILSTVLLMVSPVAASAYLLCEVDPDSGPVLTLVTVTGEIYPVVAGHDINIYWDVVNGPVATAVTKSDGTFEADFNVPADVAGDHAVIAVDMDTGALCTATFEIEPNIVLCCFCGEYCDDVQVYGTGFLADSEVEWRIGQYHSPHFDAWASDDGVYTKETGSWSTTFHVENVEPGVYLFQARDKECHCIRAEAEFIVGPLLLLDRDHGQPCEDIEVEGCLPGLEPGTTVNIYFEDLDPCIYPSGRLLVGTTTISSPCGYFEGTFHVPEVPTLGPHPYTVNATDEEETVWALAWFWVCPCIEIDPLTGVVGDTITVYGSGYAATSEVTVWMSGLLPTDVPLEAMVCFYKLMNFVWAWDETNTWLILTVGYFLPVATAETDCRGNFEAEFEIPECWGGYHPIVATQGPQDHCPGIANVIGWWEAFYDCPVFPDGLLFTCGSLVVNKPGILRVLPNIWTDPDSGVSGQTITLYGQGLSAFEFYVWYTDTNHNYCPDLFEHCKWEGEIYVYKRCSGFVLDFGPNKRWIDGPYSPYMFLCYGVGHFVMNGQFDDSWARESWMGMFPFGSYSPLMLNPRGTLVSDGMSFTTTLDVDYFEDLPGDFCDRWEFNCTFAWEYRQVGSPFLTVPWLQPQDVTLTAYRFDYIEIEFHAQWPEEDVVDLALEFFTYDQDEKATADFTIECLQVDAGPKCDLSGIEERLNALEGLTGDILEELDTIGAEIVALIESSEGNIIAEIETTLGTIQVDLAALGTEITGVITDSEGNVVLEIETALGTVQESLTAVGAKLVSLDDIEATIETALGPVKASLDDLNTYVTVDLAARLATIETDLGTIEGKLVSLSGDMATIETDVGTITTKADLLLNHTGSLPVTIALSLIAAISAIAAAVMILRKVYIA